MKNTDSGHSGVWTPAPLVPRGMTLSKLFKLSVTWFPHLWIENCNNIAHFIEPWGSNEIIDAVHVEKSLAVSKGYVTVCCHYYEVQSLLLLLLWQEHRIWIQKTQVWVPAPTKNGYLPVGKWPNLSESENRDNNAYPTFIDGLMWEWKHFVHSKNDKIIIN